VTIRTTSDGPGHPHGIATGLGPSPGLALSALKQEAQAQAERAASRHERATAPVPRPTSAPEASSAGRRTSAAAVEGAGRGPALSPLPGDSREWRFEVVGVRLMPGVIEGEQSGWLAYGTLVSAGKHPGAAGYWSGH
jgi:hypothetical protein